MTAILWSVLGAETVALCVLLCLYLRAARLLSHYRSVGDLEKYKADCERKSQSALAESERLTVESRSLHENITQQKAKVAQYQTLLGNLKSATELQEKIRSDKAKAQQLAATLGKLERASQLNEYLRGQEEAIAKRRGELEAFGEAIGDARSASEIAARVRYYENYLAELKAEVEVVEEARELQEFGYYRPRYDFDSSEEYRDRLDAIRRRQKDMLKSQSACVCTTEWSVDGSKREGQRMTDQEIKLMLRAFNGECDAAVGKVRYNNVVSLENRMKKSFEQINKLGETKRVHIVPEYCQLKYDELHLAHEYQEKKQEEKEKQLRIREQMREEEKVAKEIEDARGSAEREERLKKQALEKAREELARESGQQTAKLEALVARLENELKDAIDRKAKAIARAQLTRSGHVYVLSNIGSFGEGVYKIGLTRRLEPLERVRELGDSSVPFFFDVHAMIYSEDAPALEQKLHEHFSSRRVNMINLRREFFRVSLDEIRAAVAEYFGQVTFVTVPEAAQYRETLALRKEQERTVSPLQVA